MKIKPWIPVNEQVSSIGIYEWSVPKLIQLAKDLPVMEIPLAHINNWHHFNNVKIRDFVMHMKAVLEADLSFPIIMSEDGEIMDGRHRLMKAMLEGKETIKAVRFEVDPPPCKVNDT